MKVATNAPSRLTSVLVHSHQNSRGSPETDSRTARRTPPTDMDSPAHVSA
ncbi:hypothetical protein SFUMM280S_01275 [Streptomyces fumanus]